MDGERERTVPTAEERAMALALRCTHGRWLGSPQFGACVVCLATFIRKGDELDALRLDALNEVEAALRTAREEADEWRVVTDGTTPSEVLTRLATLTRERDEAREALGFIESAALFHPDAAWPDELKAALRRIGKLAHDALTPTPPTPEDNGR